MFVALPPVQIVAPAPAQQNTPLQAEEAKLLNCTAPVLYTFIKEVVPDFGLTQGQFYRLPAPEQNRLSSRAFYIQALQMSTLVAGHDAELAGILNRIDGKGDPKIIALDFERAYYNAFRRWPPVVPVDVDEFVARMLSGRRIR